MRPVRLRVRLAVAACVAVALHGAAIAAAAVPAWFQALHSTIQAPPSEPIAIVGGKILTQTDAGAITGTILIDAGKITAVGPDVKVPDNARRIDATGMIVTPGLIDARSTLWVTPSSRGEAAADGSLDIMDAVDAFDDDWIEVARHGVTAVYVQPGSAGTLGGRGAVLSVSKADSIADIVIQKDAAVQAQFGVGQILPAARKGQYDAVRGQFDAAKKYAEEWKKYDSEKAKADEAAKKTEKKNGEPKKDADKKDEPKKEPEKKDGAAPAAAQEPAKKEATPDAKADTKTAKAATPKKPNREQAKEFVARALKREIPVRVETHRADDIKNALKLAEDFDLRLVLDGALRAGDIADELAGRKIGFVFGPMLVDFVPPAQRGDIPADWPKSVITKDTLWALGTFGSTGRDSRLLRAHAAAAVARGVPGDLVLRAMTRGAAEVLGVADRLGTIEAGRQADIAIFAGDPLDPATAVRAVVARGRVTFEQQLAAANAAAGGAAPEKKSELPARLPDRFAIQSARVLTDAGKFESQTIVIENGKIVAARGGAVVPEGVPLYELGSAVVTPGLISTQADFGRDSDIDEITDADASNIRAIDVFDPASPAIKKMRDGGFLVALFAPGNRNVFGGAAAAVRLSATDATLAEEAAGKIVLSAASRQAERFPASLAGQLELADRVLRGDPPASDVFLSEAIRAQFMAERRRHAELLRTGKATSLIVATTRAEIAAALRLIEEHKLRAAIVAPEDLEPFAADLKRLGVAVVARPTNPNDFDRYLRSIVVASQAGAPVTFGFGSADEIRLTASAAVNLGMAPDAALRGLTSDAARVAGVADRAGTIAAGRTADLVVWDGSPLDLRSRVVRVLVAGRNPNEAK